MDSHLRTILKDPYSSIELCYQHLLRAGYAEEEIKKELIKAEKVPIYGGFEDFQIAKGLLSLEKARERVADEVFNEYDFSYPAFARCKPVTWTSWWAARPTTKYP